MAKVKKVVKKVVKNLKKKLTKEEIEEAQNADDVAVANQVEDVVASADENAIAVDTSSLSYFADASGETGAVAGSLLTEGEVATGLTATQIVIGTLVLGGIAVAASGGSGGGTPPPPSDTTPPTLSSSIPADGSTSFALNSNIILTFSEAVKAGSGNIVITNEADANDTRTISITDPQITISGNTVTINPTTNLADSATYHITIASGVIKDMAGNNYAGISDVAVLNFTTTVADSMAPSVTITDDESGTGNIAGGDITYTFIFDEAVTGFTADDITVANGAKGAFSGSGTTYTLVVTPTAGFEGNVTVDVPAGGAFDVANNGNTVATQSVQTVDMKALASASSGAVTTNDINTDQQYSEGDTITIKFSEAVDTSTITLANLALSGGHIFGTGATISPVSESGGYATSFMITLGTGFTVAGSDTITIAPANVVDIADNAASSNVVFTLPATIGAPTATITMDDITLKAGDTSTVTITFSEAVSGFALEDLTAENGVLSNLVQDGTDAKKWTATFTPNAPIEDATNAITLANSYTNTAGNTGTTASSVNYEVDTKAPTVTTVEDNLPGTANAATTSIAYTYTFSEAVTGLAVGDFTATNGTVTSVTGSGTTWTVNVTPAAGVASGNISLVLAAGAVSDTALNPNVATTNSSQAIDTVAPTLSSSNPMDNSTTFSSSGNITLTFNENVAIGSGNIVITNEANASDTRTISITDVQVTINGNTVTINPTSDLISGNTYNITMASGVLLDSAGNPYAGINTTTVLNFTTTPPDTTPPEMIDMYFAAGATTTLTIVFNEDVAMGSGAIEFYLNSKTKITPQSVNISGSTVTVTFNEQTTADDYILVNADTGSVVDIAGNLVKHGTIAVGTQGNDINIDVSDFNAVCSGITPYSDHITIVGSNGNDNITGSTYGSNNDYDYIVAGEGADTISSRSGTDLIDLSEITHARDVVKVVVVDNDTNSNWNNAPYNIDIVIDFDTTSGTPTNHDVLGFRTVQIAANLGITDGIDAGSISKHSITSGIITFYDNNDTEIVIKDTNIGDAIAYLQNNISNIDDIVGFNMDIDSNGSVDSLVVYQKSDDPNHDPIIALDGKNGNTLGIAAGMGVVQIVDAVGPEINGGVMNNTTYHAFTLQANEIIHSTTLNSSTVDLQIGSGSILSSTFDASSIAGIGTDTLTIDTGSSHTFNTSNYILISNTGNPTFTDTAGNSSELFAGPYGTDGIALGNTATTSIDLSGLIGNYSIYNFASGADSTLIGGSGNNEIAGGSGNDTITGEAGGDSMMGNGGDDIYIFAQGDSTAVTFHDSGNIGISNYDTFYFTNNTFDEVHSLYDMGFGDSATIQLASLMTQYTGTEMPRDQQFALVSGSINYDNGVFTVDSAGHDTMVVYDGDSSTNVAYTALVVDMDKGLLNVTNNIIAYTL